MDQNNIDRLLAKYLLGEADEAEVQEAKNWIKASDENKQHFAALKLIWNESEKLKAYSNVNEEEAWARFKQRTAQEKPVKKIPLSPLFSWQKIAASVIILLGCTWLGYMVMQKGNKQETVAVINMPDTAIHSNNAPVRAKDIAKTDSIASAQQVVAKSGKNEPENPASSINKHTIKLSKQAIAVKKKEHYLVDRTNSGAKEVICNGTPCPIEICINQTMQCPDNKPAEISSCSLLEPEQSAKLSYKSHDKIAKNCSLTIEEITITSVATGEAIILNSHSSPSTAQDLFSYINGEKKGEILAGMFHADCNNQTNDRSLKFDNKSGNWILQ